MQDKKIKIELEAFLENSIKVLAVQIMVIKDVYYQHGIFSCNDCILMYDLLQDAIRLYEVQLEELKEERDKMNIIKVINKDIIKDAINTAKRKND